MSNDIAKQLYESRPNRSKFAKKAKPMTNDTYQALRVQLENTVLNSFEPITIDHVKEYAYDDYQVVMDDNACAALATRVNAYGLGEIVANLFETDYKQNITWIREDAGMDREDSSADAGLIADKRNDDIQGYMHVFRNLAPQS